MTSTFWNGLFFHIHKKNVLHIFHFSTIGNKDNAKYLNLEQNHYLKEMKYIVGDYCISLEVVSVPMFSLTVEDKCHFSAYKCEFDFNIFATDFRQFEAVMKKFFEAAYFFRIENGKYEKYVFQIETNPNGLVLSFKIVVEEMVVKELTLQLHPILTDTARIVQLEEKQAAITQQLQEEKAARIAAGTVSTQQLQEEKAARIAARTVLTQQLQEEKAARIAARTVSTQQLQEEKAARIVSQEKQAATIRELQTEINKLKDLTNLLIFYQSI